LACTHYPLIQKKIKEYLPPEIQVVAQGDIVAKSLQNYLQRHPEMEQKLTRNGSRQFFTTSDDTPDFDHHASMFFGEPVKSEYLPLK
jgi:glutamate racemase